jgi:hypothetical protein
MCGLAASVAAAAAAAAPSAAAACVLAAQNTQAQPNTGLLLPANTYAPTPSRCVIAGSPCLLLLLWWFVAA